MIKVNHAGEHGAINIYSGQIMMARFTAPDLLDELREFRAHEQGHRDIFEEFRQSRVVNEVLSIIVQVIYSSIYFKYFRIV